MAAFFIATNKMDDGCICLLQAITTQEGLSRWWIADANAKAELGFVDEFVVNEKITNKMKIIDLEPNERMEWECIDGHPEWIGTKILFEIEEVEGILYVDFKHSGWKKQTKFCGFCNFQWGKHLLMLKNLCETGKV